MAKIVKNTTASDITISRVGVTISASSQHTIEVQEYLLWGNTDALAEITPYVVSGDIVINDGIMDLSVGDGINFLEYPDTAFNARFLSDPERVNGFASKTVQEAIEEAASGSVVSISPTTTIGAVTAVAYTTTLDPDTAYKFTAEIEARRIDLVGEDGMWRQEQRCKRDGLSSAALVGYTFQNIAHRDDSDMDVYWDVSGNQVQLKVVGVAGKTIKWQPKVQQIKVS